MKVLEENINKTFQGSGTGKGFSENALAEQFQELTMGLQAMNNIVLSKGNSDVKREPPK